ncbi:MAG: D-alanine--D-alanine ligase [Methylotenera sp.]|nr:D-alanine--D-alanine ligase [Oligoflexia bacterium]
MTTSKKIRVAVLYGGRSGEHEVSLRSAASVLRNLDTSRFEIVPIAIDKQGKWHLNDVELLASAGASLPVFENSAEVVLPANPNGKLAFSQGIDVVFPVMHGPLCEDGAVQGLLELAEIAYVGCGVLASAVGMDKEVAKRLIRDAGLPIVPYVSVKLGEWERNSAQVAERVGKELGYPCFVKPANMGSSVGVHKVADALKFMAAMKDAFKYDTKILIEKAIQAREVEFAVLENPVYGEPPLVSVAGEIAPTHEFYSYESKYLDENGAVLMIPAKISPEQMKQGQEIARRAFETLECEGLSRVDLFLDKNTGQFYFNEVNTLPGFTSISMYPKMWEASGVSYSELLSRLVDLALARHTRKQKISREYIAD